MHCVWRDPENDFGFDILARHRAAQHAPATESSDTMGDRAMTDVHDEICGGDCRRARRGAAAGLGRSAAAHARHHPGGCGGGAAEPAGPAHRVRDVPLGPSRGSPTSRAANVSASSSTPIAIRSAPGSTPSAIPSPAAPGAFATQVLVADDDLLPLPDGVDPVLAAAVGNSGTAAYMPLIENAGLRAGETVLVLGATGAVGQLAVQIAHQQRCGAGGRRCP